MTVCIGFPLAHTQTHLLHNKERERETHTHPTAVSITNQLNAAMLHKNPLKRA